MADGSRQQKEGGPGLAGLPASLAGAISNRDFDPRPIAAALRAAGAACLVYAVIDGAVRTALAEKFHDYGITAGFTALGAAALLAAAHIAGRPR